MVLALWFRCFPPPMPHTSPTYERLVEQMLRQLNMGHGLDELLASVFDQLSGVVPYNRIAVALLEEPAHVLRLASCRFDGDVNLKIGYAARVAGSTLAPLLETGQPRIIADLPAYGGLRRSRDRVRRLRSSARACSRV